MEENSFEMNGLLNAACQEEYKYAQRQGFGKQHIGTKLMLVVTELSEALEADRCGRHADVERFNKNLPMMLRNLRKADLQERDEDKIKAYIKAKEEFKKNFEKHIKDTFEDEIADAFMRLMDLCGEYGIDIERHIMMKAMYNEMRPPKHGKAY